MGHSNMVTDLKNDPLFERRRYLVPENPPIGRKDLLYRYNGVVSRTIAFRTIMLTVIGIIIHLAFYSLDFVMYPAYAAFFLQMRLAVIYPSVLICIPNFFNATKRFSIWTLDAIVLLHIGGLCAMIWASNGAASPYFAVINLALMGLSIVNGFRFWHTLGVCLVSIGMYVTACLFNYAGFDMPSLVVGTALMVVTAFFALMLTKFYSIQHFNSFIHNEELKESERKLRILFGLADEKSKTDDLTKIYNRRYFFEILNDKIMNCQSSKLPFYLIIFDIDYFKKINDTYGHVFGDQVIAGVAKAVRDMMRLNSYIGRYGGDEFMLIIDKATTEELLRRVGMISRAIRGLEFSFEDKKVHLTASFGIAKFDPEKKMDEKILIELADSALLEVKRTVRGEIKLANPA